MPVVIQLIVTLLLQFLPTFIQWLISLLSTSALTQPQQLQLGQVRYLFAQVDSQFGRLGVVQVAMSPQEMAVHAAKLRAE